VVCSLPASVLLLTGYWPVVGESVAICFSDGPTVLLVPEDEAELAATGFADSVETFVPGALTQMRSPSDALRAQLKETLKKLKTAAGTVGVDSGATAQGASYLGMHLFGDRLSHILRDLLPNFTITSIDKWLLDLSSVKTPLEIARIRQACAIAKHAYELGASQLQLGMKETEAAQLFRGPLGTLETSGKQIHRSDGFAFCMSGPNSAKAYAAYARTRQRRIESKDLVMIHCNSYVDGFWTDITRTFCLESPDDRQGKMHTAVFAARSAAFSTIKPGGRAVDVDSASRQVIQECGLGQFLKHGTGHGVGFSPMSAYSKPQIHAQSPDVLEEGMVFNVEPAVYIEGYGGVRHCDMVVVTNSGYELLTDFQSDVESLTSAHAVQKKRKLAGW